MYVLNYEIVELRMAWVEWLHVEYKVGVAFDSFLEIRLYCWVVLYIEYLLWCESCKAFMPSLGRGRTPLNQRVMPDFL